jgi:hypothetical protein
MNKESKKINNTNSENLQNSKFKGKKFTIIILAFFVIFLTVFIFDFVQSQNKMKQSAIKEIQNLDNIESEIIELSLDEKNQNLNEDNSDLNGEKKAKLEDQISKLTPEEFNKRGLEFIYQKLIENDSKILKLNSKINKLRREVSKYKNNENLSKLFYYYVDFRQKFFAKKNYEKELENLIFLTSFDGFLKQKIQSLSVNLKSYQTKENLIANFQKNIPQIISAKSSNLNKSFLEKIGYNLSKLVTIRKIKKDKNNPLEIDQIILQIEEDLQKENLKNVKNSIENLDQKYQKILEDFYQEINIAFEVKKADKEILNYLKNLAK